MNFRLSLADLLPAVKTLAAAVLALGLATATPARAITLEYWDFNDNNFLPSIGSGTMSTNFSGAGISIEGWGMGTTVNAQGPTVAGSSLAYLDVLTAFSAHSVRLQNLDFTGMTNVQLSFAVMSDGFFDYGDEPGQFGDELVVGYNTGSGFFEFETLADPTSDFTLRTVDFGSALDGLSGVTIGIRSNAIIEIGRDLAFDNIVVSAIPEPSSGLLLALSLGAVAFRRNRRV